MGKLKLSPSTRRELEQIVTHPDSARQLRRAQGLLWVDNGESVSSVTKRLGVTRQSFYNWRDSLKQRSGSIRRRLEDAPKSGAPRRKSDQVDKVLPDLLATHPQEKGYRATGWTRRLLTDYFVRVHQLKVSSFTLKKAIRRAGYRWKRPRYVLSRRPKHWRQAKGGLNAV